METSPHFLHQLNIFTPVSAQALFWSHQPATRAEKRHSPASREVSLNWAICLRAICPQPRLIYVEWTPEILFITPEGRCRFCCGLKVTAAVLKAARFTSPELMEEEDLQEKAETNTECPEQVCDAECGALMLI